MTCGSAAESRRITHLVGAFGRSVAALCLLCRDPLDAQVSSRTISNGC
jgi:hypothetical protein